MTIDVSWSTNYNLVLISNVANSDEDDNVLAKDDLLTQIEIFEEGFEMDFEEMEDRFQSAVVVRQ